MLSAERRKVKGTPGVFFIFLGAALWGVAPYVQPRVYALASHRAYAAPFRAFPSPNAKLRLQSFPVWKRRTVTHYRALI